jgi:hypothetical protein
LQLVRFVLGGPVHEHEADQLQERETPWAELPRVD